MATGGEAKPVLIHSPSLLRAFDSHPTYQGRVCYNQCLHTCEAYLICMQAGLVQSLISAYELDKAIRLVVCVCAVGGGG